jgi:hypothetical protein
MIYALLTRRLGGKKTYQKNHLKRDGGIFFLQIPVTFDTGPHSEPEVLPMF